MPFVEIQDVGTTQRRRLTPHRRLQVWERTYGMCVLCGQLIDPRREGWIAEHLRALELAGPDDLANMAPAHADCAGVKTREDHRRAARAKRQKIRHIGAEGSRRPLPCGRKSPLKRKLTGEIVRRLR